MAHQDHDDIVAAFRRVDIRIQLPCDRGGERGYTHLHGPSQQRGVDQCTTHWIAIEKVNGTVSLREPAGAAIGGRLRPEASIDEDPIGGSVGTKKGGFTHALTADEIRAKWTTFDDFARDAIAHVQKACPLW